MFASRTLTQLILGAVVATTALAGCSTAATQSPAGGAGASKWAPTAGLKIYDDSNAQIELVAPSGRRVLIDVWDPASITAPVTANDILLTTHGHSDHYVPDFANSFPGQKITISEGQIDLPDVKITAVAAAHDDGMAIVPTGGSDYIFVIDMEGIRVAHFGDLGQSKLTDEQLAKIGRVDVAISQLANSFSTMNATNKKGFNQMAQVKPLIFIPTHVDSDTAKIAATTWKATYSTDPITLTKSRLPSETTVVFMGPQADTFGKSLSLKPATW